MDENPAKKNLLLTIIYSVEKTLWDALGKSSFALLPFIGENLCEELNISTCEDEYESSGNAIKTVSGDFVKLGIFDSLSMSDSDSKIDVTINGCMLLPVEKKLLESGVKPFVCPVMNSMMYVLRERVRVKARVKSITVDDRKGVCNIVIEKIL